ncbi:MAG: hypothetical protein F6K31_02660 [Symploca sp. SIO2G7]|nr:hypothetical protein [Symploca sp. SIO2G7]
MASTLIQQALFIACCIKAETLSYQCFEIALLGFAKASPNLQDYAIAL